MIYDLLQAITAQPTTCITKMLV